MNVDGKLMVGICVEEYWIGLKLIDMNMELRNLWNQLYGYE